MDSVHRAESGLAAQEEELGRVASNVWYIMSLMKRRSSFSVR